MPQVRKRNPRRPDARYYDSDEASESNDAYYHPPLTRSRGRGQTQSEAGDYDSDEDAADAHSTWLHLARITKEIYQSISRGLRITGRICINLFLMYVVVLFLVTTDQVVGRYRQSSEGVVHPYFARAAEQDLHLLGLGSIVAENAGFWHQLGAASDSIRHTMQKLSVKPEIDEWLATYGNALRVNTDAAGSSTDLNPFKGMYSTMGNVLPAITSSYIEASEKLAKIRSDQVQRSTLLGRLSMTLDIYGPKSSLGDAVNTFSDHALRVDNSTSSHLESLTRMRESIELIRHVFLKIAHTVDPHGQSLDESRLRDFQYWRSFFISQRGHVANYEHHILQCTLFHTRLLGAITLIDNMIQRTQVIREQNRELREDFEQPNSMDKTGQTLSLSLTLGLLKEHQAALYSAGYANRHIANIRTSDFGQLIEDQLAQKKLNDDTPRFRPRMLQQDSSSLNNT